MNEIFKEQEGIIDDKRKSCVRVHVTERQIGDVNVISNSALNITVTTQCKLTKSLECLDSVDFSNKNRSYF